MLSWLSKLLNGVLGAMRRSVDSLSSLERNDRSSGILVVVATVLAIAIFFVDIALPLGVAGGVPYVAVLLLGLWFKSTRPLLFLAMISSVLTIAGYFFSPGSGFLWVDITNRIVALSAIWVAAVLLTKANAAESQAQTVTNRLAMVLESAVISILTIDAKGTVTSLNPAAEKFFGYRADEVIGRNVSMLMPEPYRGEHDSYIGNYLDSGQAKIIGRTREAAALRKDGQEIPIVLSVGETWSDSERVFVGFVTDITERRHAEIALLASEQRFRDIADVASDWIWETDADLRYSYFSEQMEKMTGLSARELLGRTWSVLPWIDANAPARDQLAENFNGRKSFRDIEIAVKPPSGRRCYIRVGGKPVFDDKGDFEGFRGTGTDITAQVDTEVEMARRTALFEGIIENAVEGIYRVTADGNYISVNPALAKMHGYDSPELFLENFPNRKDVYAQPEAREEVARLMRDEGSVRGFECGAKKRGHRHFWMSESGRAVWDENGNLVGYEGFVEDITERKHIEEELRQAQKMEAIGRLTGSVAHEFNNQLFAISGFARMLQRAGTAHEDEREWLENIVTATDHAASLSRGLLAFTRKQDIAPTVVSVKNLLEESRVLIQPMVGGAITARFNLHDEQTLVMVDAGQFSQALLNLAINACDAMPEGGILTIESRIAEPDSALLAGSDLMSPGPHVAISIADTGTGIDKETLNRIFEPFFTTKEAGRGTGLGLSMVYGMVQRSGGVIAVDSEVAAGTTFTIYLPLVEAEEASTEVIATSDVVPTGMETVLIAEDEPLIRDLVQITLERIGYNVLMADDGRAAYEAFHNFEGRIDLLLTDIKMPGMTGRELARALLAECPDLKVVYMTGYDSTIEDSDSSDSEDDETLLHKPFDPKDLGRTVRDVLDT